MSQIFAAPDSGDETFVFLSNSRKGRLFEKHILSYGDLLYPKAKDGKVVIDDAFADRLIENFNSKYCPYVQVPLAGDRNEHSEAPDRNIGQVVGLSKRDGKIYASIDVRKHAEDVGETLLGASALFDMNYVDTKTLKTVGPTLLHVAVTNRPYVTDLEDFSEVIAASVDSSEDEVIALSASTTDKETNMTLDEMFNTLRDEHGIDVPALQSKASEAEGVLALSARIVETLQAGDLIALSNPGDEATPEQVLAAVTAASERIVSLSTTNAALEQEKIRSKAEADVDALVAKALILPKNRDDMVELSMSNPDLFKRLLPDSPLVALTLEQGSDSEPDEQEVADAEAARIAKEHGLVEAQA